MPLGGGYTVEEQLTGSAEVGGVLLDLFEPLSTNCEFTMVSLDGGSLVFRP